MTYEDTMKALQEARENRTSVLQRLHQTSITRNVGNSNLKSLPSSSRNSKTGKTSPLMQGNVGKGVMRNIRVNMVHMTSGW